MPPRHFEAACFYLSASSSVRQPVKPSSLQLTFLLRLAHLFVRHIVQREIFRRWRKLNHSLFYMHVGLEFFALWHCLAFKRWFKRTQVAIFNNVATCHKIACYLCRIAQNSRNFLPGERGCTSHLRTKAFKIYPATFRRLCNLHYLFAFRTYI